MQPSDRFADLMGAQRPNRLWLPKGIVDSAGPAAVALAEVAGLSLDPWQQWCLEQLLSEKDELYYNPFAQKYMRKSAAYQAALIVARQNGKGAILEALEIAWLYLTGQKTIVHSAHEFPTSREHFQRIEGLINETPELKAELARGGIKWSHGDESITLAPRPEFGPGSARLLFKTRTKGAARGFTIWKLVMDEAMILGEQAVKAMTFATSAAPDPQIILTGSAGDQDSVYFGKARANGIKGSDPRLFFAEWSADLCTELCPPGRDTEGRLRCREHDDPGDPEVWAKTNPGLGRRIQAENVESEYLNLPSGAFAVERLTVGDWPVDDDAWAVISEESWLNCYDELSRSPGPYTFSIDTSPDKRYSAICAAGGNGEGSIHIEVTGKGELVDYRPGTTWVVERAKQINRRARNAQWVIDKGTQAGAYWDELEKAGLKLITLTTREYAQACGDFYASVVPIGGSTPDVRHGNQPELSAAVAAAEKRDLADMWAWDKRNSNSDITALVAATNALWGHRKRVNKPRPKPMALWG